MSSEVEVNNPAEVTSRKSRKNSKESIHSGHFMISEFEEDDVINEIGLDVECPVNNENSVEEIQGVKGVNHGGVIVFAKPTKDKIDPTTISIEATLTKLFHAMSLAYRQNISCPKWNCFKGIRMRWKDKIRLNNVIWRCWHMQYIHKKNMNICQFELDDDDIRPELIILEGKYWKRNLNAITAEYQKWRKHEKRRLRGLAHNPLEDMDLNIMDFESMDCSSTFFLKSNFSLDDPFFSDSCDFTDILFSGVDNPQPFQFPNPREIARSIGNSDLLQPGLVQLQPNLSDFDMLDIQEMINSRPLPTVPEEDMFTEVEENVGLPPSSSPPSVSTPVPTTQLQEYNARFTALPDDTALPQLFSPQESFIPGKQCTSSSISLPNPLPIATTTPPLSHDRHSINFDSSKAEVNSTLSPAPTLFLSTAESKSASVPSNLHRQTIFLSPPADFAKSSSVPSSLHTRTTLFLATPDTKCPSVEQFTTAVDPTTRYTPIQPQPVVAVSTVPCPTATWNPASGTHGHTAYSQVITGQNQSVFPLQHTFIAPKIYPKKKSGGLNVKSPPCPYFSASPSITFGSATVTSSSSVSSSSGHSNLRLRGGTTTTLHPHLAPLSSKAGGDSIFISQLLSPGVPPTSTDAELNPNNVLRNNSVGVHGSSSVWDTTFSSPQLSQYSVNNQQESLLNSARSSSPFALSASCSPSVKGCVTPLLLPNVSLSTVVPSSVKSIRQPVSMLTPNISSSSLGPLVGSLSPPIISCKNSPPECEHPRSPLQSNSSSSPPIKPFRPKNEAERMQYKEHRRVCHINAEQKRRCHIKNNFDLLHSLVLPTGGHSTNAKISKAMMLHKGAEYIVSTKQERVTLSERAEKLRCEIESLSSEISHAQSLLPATGAPISHARHNKIKEKFEIYMRDRALQDPKYFVMGLIAQPLLESFNSTVSTASVDDLCRSAFAWLDQQCNLNALRPVVSNAMRKLSVSTNVLTSPDLLTEEIFQCITKQEDGGSSDRRDTNTFLLLNKTDRSGL